MTFKLCKEFINEKNLHGFKCSSLHRRLLMKHCYLVIFFHILLENPKLPDFNFHRQRMILFILSAIGMARATVQKTPLFIRDPEKPSIS